MTFVLTVQRGKVLQAHGCWQADILGSDGRVSTIHLQQHGCYDCRACSVFVSYTLSGCLYATVDLKRTVGLAGIEPFTTILAYGFQGHVCVCVCECIWLFMRAFKDKKGWLSGY